VTGGSSGIGLALVERLAGQGLNVVVVAFPDATFDKNFSAVVAKFPHLQFRKVAVNLGLVPETFLPAIQKAIADIDVQIVFNNAGYSAFPARAPARARLKAKRSPWFIATVKTGFFLDVSLEQGLLNHNCNATSAVAITHLLGNQMLNKHLRGCICYTSSPAGFTPTPFTVLYGSTKAFLTEFAMSIAAELSPQGIDVCVVHPSPVASRFYDGAHSLGALNFFKGTATGPDRIACVVAPALRALTRACASVALLKSIGRTVVCDQVCFFCRCRTHARARAVQGYYPPVARLLGKVLDITLFADLTAAFAGSMPEFKQLLVKRP